MHADMMLAACVSHWQNMRTNLRRYNGQLQAYMDGELKTKPKIEKLEARITELKQSSRDRTVRHACACTHIQ